MYADGQLKVSADMQEWVGIKIVTVDDIVKYLIIKQKIKVNTILFLKKVVI